MLANLRCLVKSLPNSIQVTKRQKLNKISKPKWFDNQIASHFYSEQATPPSATDCQIIDVNSDEMMGDDNESGSNFNNDPVISSGPTVAPIDIDCWIDEELDKSGTIYMEAVENIKEEIHYPAPPNERSGYYEFEGIKIWLPQKMLTPATYRYRLDDGEEETLPDDIRICKFENYKPPS